ncbi:hypothetical protein SAMN05421578_11771 [Paenibacillus macquariensis]|uniref:Glyoxalase/fosfomycin resistance/dioxygenase domain-containing protein n=1 Tax=Paenibacillus macquariensis TaxID=948756 RepID=A0ABY1KB14_9BACL|nr:hypothetical protein SAMN05421578_11771 [Paenibacillus macquariensis]
MINNLYETQLQVKDLNTSIAFFEKLGLELALLKSERKMAFFNIGKDRQLLGIREVPTGAEVSKRHFAFGVDLSDLMKSYGLACGAGYTTIKLSG